MSGARLRQLWAMGSQAKAWGPQSPARSPWVLCSPSSLLANQQGRKALPETSFHGGAGLHPVPPVPELLAAHVCHTDQLLWCRCIPSLRGRLFRHTLPSVWATFSAEAWAHPRSSFVLELPAGGELQPGASPQGSAQASGSAGQGQRGKWGESAVTLRAGWRRPGPRGL